MSKAERWEGRKKYRGGRIYIIIVGVNQLNWQNFSGGGEYCVCVRDKCRRKTEILYRQ
jgi:hypothetical protein